MKIHSTRFGELNLADEQLLRFPQGLPGFPQEDRFALLPQGEESPFFFLQSAQDADLAFLLVDPFAFFRDYQFNLDDSLVQELSVSAAQPPLALCIVTVPAGRLQDMTANLGAPLVINQQARLGRQVVLTDSAHSLRQRLYINAPEGGA